jgi:hypothetical protein
MTPHCCPSTCEASAFEDIITIIVPTINAGNKFKETA